MEKEIGGEIGIITFGAVSFISIANCFPGETIQATPVRELTEAFWSRHSAFPDSFDPADTAYQIYDQEGPVHVVVAQTISYELKGS